MPALDEHIQNTTGRSYEDLIKELSQGGPIAQSVAAMVSSANWHAHHVEALLGQSLAVAQSRVAETIDRLRLGLGLSGAGALQDTPRQVDVLIARREDAWARLNELLALAKKVLEHPELRFEAREELIGKADQLLVACEQVDDSEHACGHELAEAVRTRLGAS